MTIDFFQMLLRRKVSIKRWLTSENINTRSQFDGWMTNNEAHYHFSDQFKDEVYPNLTATLAAYSDLVEESPVDPRLEAILGDMLASPEKTEEPVEAPAAEENPSERQSRKQRAKAVQNPPREE